MLATANMTYEQISGAIFPQTRQEAEKSEHRPSDVLKTVILHRSLLVEDEEVKVENGAKKREEDCPEPLPIFLRVLEYDNVHRRAYMRAFRRRHREAEVARNAQTAQEDVTGAFRRYVASRREDEHAARREIDAAVRTFEGRLRRCLARVYRYDGLSDECRASFLAYARNRAAELVAGNERIRRSFGLGAAALARGQEEDRYLAEVWLQRKVEECWGYYQRRLMGTVPRYLEGHPVRDDLMRDQDVLRRENLEWQQTRRRDDGEARRIKETRDEVIGDE